MRKYILNLKRSFEEMSLSPIDRQVQLREHISNDIANRLPLPQTPVDQPYAFYQRECAPEVSNLLEKINSTMVLDISECSKSIYDRWFNRYKVVFDQNHPNASNVFQEIAKEAEKYFPTASLPETINEELTENVSQSVVSNNESIKIKRYLLISSLEDCQDAVTGEDLCVSLAISIAYKLPLANIVEVESESLYYYNHLREDIDKELAPINERTPFNLDLCNNLIEGIWKMRCELFRNRTTSIANGDDTRGPEDNV